MDDPKPSPRPLSGEAEAGRAERLGRGTSLPPGAEHQCTKPGGSNARTGAGKIALLLQFSGMFSEGCGDTLPKRTPFIYGRVRRVQPGQLIAWAYRRASNGRVSAFPGNPS